MSVLVCKCSLAVQGIPTIDVAPLPSAASLQAAAQADADAQRTDQAAPGAPSGKEGGANAAVATDKAESEHSDGSGSSKGSDNEDDAAERTAGIDTGPGAASGATKAAGNGHDALTGQVVGEVARQKWRKGQVVPVPLVATDAVTVQLLAGLAELGVLLPCLHTTRFERLMRICADLQVLAGACHVYIASGPVRQK